jgi:lipopolysaccharide transport system permease protein
MRATRDRRQLADLAIVLVLRDLRVTYGQALLGLVWAPLTALVQVAVLTFLFTRVVPLDVEDYAAFAYSGIAIWQVASIALTGGAEAFTANRDLVRRPGFPTVVLPGVSIGGALSGYVLSLPVLLLAMALLDRLTFTAVSLPVVVAAAALVLVGPALVVATLNVRYRDVRHLVGVALAVLFYLTPVFYEVDRIPERWRWIAEVNPLALVVRLHRDVLYEGVWPDPLRLVTCAVVGVVGAVAGLAVFRRAEPHLADDL